MRWNGDGPKIQKKISDVGNMEIQTFISPPSPTFILTSRPESETFTNAEHLDYQSNYFVSCFRILVIPTCQKTVLLLIYFENQTLTSPKLPTGFLPSNPQ